MKSFTHTKLKRTQEINKVEPNEYLGDITRVSLRFVPSVVIAVFLIFTAVPIVADAATFSIVYNGGIRNIEPDTYLLVKGVKALEDAGLSCNVTVLYGPNVDLLIMDKVNFESYKQGTSFSYLGLSRLNINMTFIASAVGELVTGTEYYLVIDNTDRPSGGASPLSENGRSQIVYEFGAVNVLVVDLGPGSNIIMIIILMSVIAAIIVVVLVLVVVMRKRGKPKQTAPYHAFSGVKVCPRCGMQSSSEHQFCPNCGSRLQ